MSEPTPRPPIVQGVTQVTRETFLAECWDYRYGGDLGAEHVSFIAQTGWGKTTWMLELIDATATPKMPVIVMETKPHDKSMTRVIKANGWERTERWPPLSRQFGYKRTGYVFWPKHTYDPDVDLVAHYQAFRYAMLRCYRDRRWIVDLDEVFTLGELGLTRVMNTLWKNGRSMDTGVWAGTQEPFNVPSSMYRQAQHLFLGGINDKRAHARFAEIVGGFDPDLIKAIVTRLPQYCWLYLRPRDGTMCIVLDT